MKRVALFHKPAFCGMAAPLTVPKYPTLRWTARPELPVWRALAACRTEALRLNAESDFAVAGFRLALDRTLIPV